MLPAGARIYVARSSSADTELVDSLKDKVVISDLWELIDGEKEMWTPSELTELAFSVPFCFGIQLRREERAEKVRNAQPHVEDVSVFPMAMPMLAGPGSIASIMLLTARAHGTEETAVVLAALGVVMLLSLIALVAATPIIRVLGKQVEAVVTRLLGVLLAALAAQFVIDGLRTQF